MKYQIGDYNLADAAETDKISGNIIWKVTESKSIYNRSRQFYETNTVFFVHGAVSAMFCRL